MPGAAWPQAIPPAAANRVQGQSPEGDLPSGESGSVPEGAPPVGPQPARGSRAILDTTFAKSSGTTRYPGRERSEVVPALSVTRYRQTSSNLPRRQSSQSVLRTSDAARTPSRVIRYTSAVQRPVSMTVLESPRTRQTTAVYSGTSRIATYSATAARSLTPLHVGGRTSGEQRKSFTEYPQYAAVPVEAGSPRTNPRPVQRSSQRVMVVTGGSLRRSTHSGLIELGAGATDAPRNSLAYVAGVQKPHLPELKIGRR